MTELKGYFTALIATALFSVIVVSVAKDHRIKTLVQVSTGVLLLLVFLKPVTSLDLDSIKEDLRQIIPEGSSSSDYERLYQEKLQQQVRSLTEKYVMEKAKEVGASVTVKVTVRDHGYPIPNGIRISGILRPEQQHILQEYITASLGIPHANQRWDLYESIQG